MFGNKAERIAQLEDEKSALESRVAIQSELLAQVDPFLEIAKEIHNKYQAGIEGTEVEDLDTLFDRVIEDVKKDKLKQQAEQIVEKLPIEQLLGLYAVRLGDDTINSIIQERAEREKRWLPIKEEARISGMLDLCKIDQGEQITIDFNFTTHYSIPRPFLHLRRRDDNEHIPIFQLTKDAKEYHSFFTANTVLRIGSLIVNDEGNNILEPNLTQGAPMGYLYGQNSPGVIASCLISQVFLGGDKKLAVFPEPKTP